MLWSKLSNVSWVSHKHYTASQMNQLKDVKTVQWYTTFTDLPSSSLNERHIFQVQGIRETQKPLTQVKISVFRQCFHLDKICWSMLNQLNNIDLGCSIQAIHYWCHGNHFVWINSEDNDFCSVPVCTVNMVYSTEWNMLTAVSQNAHLSY